MVKGYKLDGLETKGDKPVENGLKMMEFGLFWLELKKLSCLTQTVIINESHPRATHEKEGFVSPTALFCAKRITNRQPPLPLWERIEGGGGKLRPNLTTTPFLSACALHLL